MTENKKERVSKMTLESLSAEPDRLTNPEPRRSVFACHEYNMALASLNDAEELHDMLERNPLPGNDYWCDAVARADELVTEMTVNLQHVFDSFTPEECGL